MSGNVDQSKPSQQQQQQQPVNRPLKKLQSLSGFLGVKNTKGSFDILRDPVKQRHQQLSEEYDDLICEYKRLKSYVEHLEREYLEGKALDPARRYVKLKGMIKRTVTYLHVQNVANDAAIFDCSELPTPGLAGMLQGTRNFAQKADSQMKRDEMYKTLNSEELQKQTKKLEDDLKECKRRIAMITDLIHNLESQYASTKQCFPLKRYSLMKGMVKNITHNHLIRDKIIL